MKQDDEITTRPAVEADAEVMAAIAGDVFDRAAIDYWIEEDFGPINGISWRRRKEAAVRLEVLTNPSCAVVAEAGGEVVGFITTFFDPATRIGHIPNFAVRRDFQGRGLGKRLLQAGYELLVAAGAIYLQIETLDTNEVGQALYPSVGFREVTRRIYYFMEADQWRPPS
jgi:ribosomal protein S18 acetylase RimI-like enzyme